MKMKSHKYFAFAVVLLAVGISSLFMNGFNEEDNQINNREKKQVNSKQEILVYDREVGPVYDDVYDEDKVKRHWPGGREGFIATNLEKAALDIENRMGRLIPYISDCKRFPLNLEDAYKPIKNAPKGCYTLKPRHSRIVTPWLDPWGRHYQIRYHKERLKLQMRSQGRRLDDPSDDIVRETNLSIHKDVYYAEVEKCKKLSSEDKSCVFNRGWH